jgi:hypothetical protein
MKAERQAQYAIPFLLTRPILWSRRRETRPEATKAQSLRDFDREIVARMNHQILPYLAIYSHLCRFVSILRLTGAS